MGAASWQDDILQALLIGLVVQIVASVFCVFCASLWASWKERTARPPTGESMAESDLEMGALNVGEGATIVDNPPGLAASSGVGDGGKLEITEDTADTRTSTSEIPTVHGSSNNPPGLAANSGVGDGEELEDTEDTADTRANTPEIPTVDHLVSDP